MCILLLAGLAFAQVQVPVTAFGMYYTNGFHSPAYEMYRVGRTGGGSYNCDRNYFAMNVANLQQDVESCSISFTANWEPDDPTDCTIKFINVENVDFDDLTGSYPDNSPAGYAIWQELADDALPAMASRVGSADEPFVVQMAPAGVSAINAARGSTTPLVFGGSFGPQSCTCQSHILDNDNDGEDTEITVTCVLVSVTPTSSTTPTISETSSITPSISETPSISDSASPSISETSSNTPSTSFTASNTPSISETASNTPSISETSSITPSISDSSSNTPSTTSTSSETPSISDTASVSPTISETPSITPTRSPDPPEDIPENPPPSEPGGLSTGAIAGIAIGGAAVVAVGAGVAIWRIRARRRGYREIDGVQMNG